MIKKIFLSFAMTAIAFPTIALEKYPEKPITLIVPFAPGSATDSVARIVTSALSERIGQTVIVDNRPGASGQIGATQAAKSQPDGYTLIMATSGTHNVNPSVNKDVPYDPIKDFSPVLLVGEVPFALVVNNNLPVKSTKELVVYAKNKPNELFYAYASPTAEIAGKTFVNLAEIESGGVPYKSSPQAAVDLISGLTQFYFIDFGTGLPHIREGKIRAVAVAGSATNLLPGVPPISETIPAFSLTSWNGIFAPAGTSDEIINYLNDNFRAVLAQESVRERLTSIGFEILGTGTPEEFSELVRNELEKWQGWVKDAGLTKSP